MKRTLRLNRETLTELAADDLTGVAGAAADFTRIGLTCPLLGCASDLTVLPQCGISYNTHCC